MAYSTTSRHVRDLLAAILLAGGLLLPAAARAQVVVVANGSPITELDIAQRTKLVATSTRKAPSRQEVIQELIDDRIKIAKAKVYGMEIGDTEVDNAFQNMAARQHLNAQQFSQVLERSGIMPQTVKARIKAQLTWNQLVRAKFGSSLEVSDADVTKALMETKESDTAVGYIYTLYPVVVLAPRGSAESVLRAKLQEAAELRSRFTACNSGLAMARAMRDVAVREPVTRASADLPEQFRQLLNSIELGHLTQPEPTDQGLQMFAVCNKRQTTADTPAKRQAKEQIFNKRFEVESKRFLDEIRKQAMIEYKAK
ncbi:MAG TPA: SurA N-terminal domain-containing protein [Pseudolabrys sp.]|jgi:peptidyl-prolyl cis-trans isomerase SurA|nr:SurA N-terminal domain-containing protein [Pseudolabrys sp.]